MFHSSCLFLNEFHIRGVNHAERGSILVAGKHSKHFGAKCQRYFSSPKSRSATDRNHIQVTLWQEPNMWSWYFNPYNTKNQLTKQATKTETHIRLSFTKSYIFLADHTDKKYQLKLGPEACLAVTIAHRYYECSQGHDRRTTIKKSCMVRYIFHGYYSFFYLLPNHISQ